MSQIIIGKAHGKNIGFDTDLLLAGRLLITADSGAGKSWLARVLFEQAFGKLQQIIIDPEGEFASLREKFPFVLAGKGGDTPVDVRSAGLLAHRLLKLRVSAVCDLYELRADLRHVWVKNFFEALIEAPKELRAPLLVGVDEFHMFAPEKGQGESEALAACTDVATRGRKRGICLAGMTQRLAMLNKNVTSQLQNRLVGAQFEEVNIKAAVKLLGIAPGAEEREFHKQIQLLEPGNFWAFGRAISRERVLVKVRDVMTSHPKAFEKHTAPLPPIPEKIKGLLPQLADLPKEAEDKARTEAEFRREIRELNQKLKAAERAQPTAPTITKTDPHQARTIQQLRSGLEEAVKIIAKVNAYGFKMDGADVDSELFRNAVQKAATEVSKLAAKAIESRQAEFEQLKREANRTLAKLQRLLGEEEIQVAVNVTRNEPVTVTQASPRPRASASADSQPSSLPDGEKSILIAIAQYPEGAQRDQLSILTGYKRSTRDAYVQRLTNRGFVSAGGSGIVATQEGIDALGTDYEPLPTGDDLQNWWLNRLPDGERKILRELINQYPRAVTRDALDEPTGFKRSTRDAYIQRLTARRVVEISGGALKAADSLFDQGAA